MLSWMKLFYKYTSVQTVVRWLDKNVEHDSLDPQERKEILCLMLSRHELR
jgi:hypothetical protein